MIFSCDFENTVNKLDETRVWAFSMIELFNHDNFIYGTSIDEWFDILKKFPDVTTCYFHNLGYDGYLIIDWLYRNGYKYSKEPKPKTFSTLISKFNVFYQIEIIFEAYDKTYQKVIIQDSYKKLPLSVKALAKTFNLEIQKTEIDYIEDRPIDHVLTSKEIEYIKNDVEIVAFALENQINKGLDKMTIGADSLSYFKDYCISEAEFKRYFPQVNIEVDKDIRRAYRGGFVYVKEDIQGKELGHGVSYDVNSLYPSVMYNKPMPVGFPMFFKGEYKEDKKHTLYIQYCIAEFSLKDGHVPTIQVKNNLSYKPTEYIKESIEPTELYLTNVDMEIFKEHYYIHNIRYVCGYKFKQKSGLFKTYIDKWTFVKENSVGGMRLLAKLMLNNLYGKFAKNTDVTGKIPVMNWDKNKLQLVMDEEETSQPVYTPVAVFITSYARQVTINAVQANYNRFCYCDTDSIHLIGTQKAQNIEVHDTKLGAWKKEGEFVRAKFLRAKTYAEEFKDGTVDYKCAGMTQAIKDIMTWDRFKLGFEEHNAQLKKKIVKGGVILHPTSFRIKS